MTELQPGDAAPDFTLQDAAGTPVALSGRDRSTVVYFYPKAATPGCTTEACDFRDNLASLQGAGYDVIGISPDSAADIAAFAADQHLTFPLLSDPGASVAKAYGAWGEKEINGVTVTGILRSTFVIGPEGSVEVAQYRVDATGHVARLRRELGVDA
jgi:peroxiredoxin Q/BCP